MCTVHDRRLESLVVQNIPAIAFRMKIKVLEKLVDFDQEVEVDPPAVNAFEEKKVLR